MKTYTTIIYKRGTWPPRPIGTKHTTGIKATRDSVPCKMCYCKNGEYWSGRDDASGLDYMSYSTTRRVRI